MFAEPTSEKALADILDRVYSNSTTEDTLRAALTDVYAYNFCLVSKHLTKS